MRMIISRNRSSHTYKKSSADEIADLIQSLYIDEFMSLEESMRSIQKSEKQ